ncbi:MAG: alpha/beta hydrolase [Acidobacteriota bacterium]|nr:MAG: alpha/beta hydrolase [Acidobacteriota bacterium]
MNKQLSLAVAAILILASACAPRSPETPGELAEAPLLENGSFDVVLDGIAIHYEVHGTGPVLMTVPNSWGLTLEGLRAVYRPLEEHVTIVYFDPRGMGRSGPIREAADMGLEAVREDFDALRRHLGLDRVHAIGWSNGATNLILLALEYPEALSSAIFLHAAPSFTEDDAAALQADHQEMFASWAEFEQFLSRSEMTAEESNEQMKQFLLEKFFPQLFADEQAARARVELLFKEAGFSLAHSQYSDAEMPIYDFRDRLAEIPVRSLVIAGRHDLLPPEKVAELSDGLADSQFVVFEQSGHFAPVEEPEKFIAAVVEFLDTGA